MSIAHHQPGRLFSVPYRHVGPSGDRLTSLDGRLGNFGCPCDVPMGGVGRLGSDETADDLASNSSSDDDPATVQAKADPNYGQLVSSIASGAGTLATDALRAYQMAMQAKGMSASQIAQMVGLAQKQASGGTGLSLGTGLGIGAAALGVVLLIVLATRRNNPWVSWEGGGRAANPRRRSRR